MEERSLLHSIKAYESHATVKGAKIINTWKIKLFRLIRYMDLSQTIESSLVQGMFIFVQSIQLIYYYLAIYVYSRLI